MTGVRFRKKGSVLVLSNMNEERERCPYGYRGPFGRIYQCTSVVGHTDAHVKGEIKWTEANPLSVLIDE